MNKSVKKLSDESIERKNIQPSKPLKTVLLKLEKMSLQLNDIEKQLIKYKQF